MNDSNLIFDLVILVVLGIIPLFAGALKGYSANGIIRILARFAAPTVSALAITFVVLYHSRLLSPLGIIFDNYDYDSANQEYVAISIAISFVVMLWLLFYKLVSFGESIGQEEDAGLRADGTKITKQVNQIITPTLDEFAEKMQANTEEKLEDFTSKLTDTIIPEINKIAENQQNIQESINTFNKNEEQRRIHQIEQDKRIAWLLDSQHDQNDLLRTIKEWFLQNPNTYEILTSQIEAIKIQQQNNIIHNSNHSIKNDSEGDGSDTNDNDDKKDSSSAKLTTFDGIANRTIGHKNQQEMAQYLRDIGFEIVDGHGLGQPDFIIKKKNRVIGHSDDWVNDTIEKNTTAVNIVAVGSNKSFTLKDQSGRRQRKIYAADCMPEIILARKLEIPMIVFVTNRNNGRRWAKKITYDELLGHNDEDNSNNTKNNTEWEGISTPLLLVQEDEDSAQKLEEEFLTVLSSIGGNV